MDKIFRAFDGSLFSEADECFNYEWRERCPNMLLFDWQGKAVSRAALACFAITHDENEHALLEDFLRYQHGMGLEHIDHWYNDTQALVFDFLNVVCFDPQIIEEGEEATAFSVSDLHNRDRVFEDLPEDCDLRLAIKELVTES